MIVELVIAITFEAHLPVRLESSIRKVSSPRQVIVRKYNTLDRTTNRDGNMSVAETLPVDFALTSPGRPSTINSNFVFSAIVHAG